MTKFLATLVFLVGSVALAADGTAKLHIFDFNAGYDLEQNGNKITGTIYNFGSGGTSKVDLTKKDGAWSGRLGFTQVQAKAPVQKGEKTEVSLSVLPGGFHFYSAKTEKDNDFSISGSTSSLFLHGFLKADYSELAGGNEYASMSLKKDKTGAYVGNTYIRRGFGDFPYVARTTLETAGSLAPQAVKNDAALFALLYIVPFSER